MKQVYLAHALGAETPEGITRNKEQAQRWLQWACDNYRGTHCFNMMWLLEVAHVYTPEQEVAGRAAGMARCIAHIERVDELWLMGTKVSKGMTDEGEHARRCGYRVYDLTTETLDPRTAPRFPPEDMVLWKSGSLTQQVMKL